MNVRNKELLARFANHPLKTNLQRVLDASERFAAASQRIRGNPNLSDQGRSNELQAQARLALRDFRDLGKPVDDMRARRAQIADSVKRPAFDPHDFSGAVRRAELRSVVASKPMAKRLEWLNDPAYRDAILEQPPGVSGFDAVGEVEAFARAKTFQLEQLHAPTLREIEAIDDEIGAADAIMSVVRNDVRRELGFGDNEQAFNEFAKPIETRINAPWLKREKDMTGAERIVRITAADPDFDGKSAGARPATSEEIRDGKFFANVDEFRAHRAS